MQPAATSVAVPTLERREQEQPDGRDRRAHDREHAVATVARDQEAASGRADEHTEHHRRHQQPGLGRAVALDDLQVERDERDGAEEREADNESDRARRPERHVAEEFRRQDRLRRARLDEREQREQRDAADDRCEHSRRVPGVARAAEAGVEDDARQPGREDDRPEPVYPVLRRHLARAEGSRDHRERDDAERQVDVEDPPPRQRQRGRHDRLVERSDEEHEEECAEDEAPPTRGDLSQRPHLRREGVP
jgi:hypothetical protein